ncbi:hypothetical protein BTR40_24245 [Vibrio parahaemolyticus]|nr:hypothetical protein BTR40_24245 [Vibrio parahaemolyticus]
MSSVLRKAVADKGNNGETKSLTKRLRRIHNAWHFRFKISFVFTEQWFRFSGRVVHPLTGR